MRFALGLFARVLRRPRPPVSSSTSSYKSRQCSLTNTLGSSDFENKFVCGEIMAYNDLHEYGSEAAVKAAGKLRQQGKPYESMYLSFFIRLAPC